MLSLSESMSLGVRVAQLSQLGPCGPHMYPQEPHLAKNLEGCCHLEQSGGVPLCPSTYPHGIRRSRSHPTLANTPLTLPGRQKGTPSSPLPCSRTGNQPLQAEATGLLRQGPGSLQNRLRTSGHDDLTPTWDAREREAQHPWGARSGKALGDTTSKQPWL